ncbi:MAG: bifunctional adenosylcobinamide kinase/adenosylcobinamide-phosphate guanylyltransferase [Paracoccaceae bacterium]
MFPKVTLILGGVSSGKSSFAEGLVKSYEKPAVYIATALASDGEMADKITRHQRSRGEGWHTMEVPLDVAGALADIAAAHVVLLDCASMWLSNQMLAGADLAQKEVLLLAALKDCASPVVVVSNEVGLGGVPENALARKFGQAQGVLNIALARQADLVVQVVAGLSQVLKGRLP